MSDSVPARGLSFDRDGRHRCAWCAADDGYRAYHDTEWGRPVADDRTLFEKICLEGFQSGLSWLTILRKRENFRKAFAHFDAATVAAFTEADVARLVGDAGIIRHAGKIRSTINNAARALELKAEFGTLAACIWRYEPDPASLPKSFDWDSLRRETTSPQSIALSKDLKKRGWSFVGPTTCQAFLQAMGLLNHHIDGCWVREAVEADRAAFVRPGR
jgi:DNA-3-methyladenine glycosylase I